MRGADTVRFAVKAIARDSLEEAERSSTPENTLTHCVPLHFSERSRAERGRRTSERHSLEAGEDEPRCFRLGVTLWLTLGFHAALCPLPDSLQPPPTPPPFQRFPLLPLCAPLLLLLLYLLLSRFSFRSDSLLVARAPKLTVLPCLA